MSVKTKYILTLAAGGLFLLLPQVSRAATLYVSPASGSFSVGSSFTVRVLTNTQGASVNTAEVNLSYSVDTLELVRVSAGSDFPLQTPGSPAKTASGAFFSGGIPMPGYTGNSGVVGVMTFRAKSQGRATVSIGSGKVLLNDGQGTDALNGTANASYTIIPPPVGVPEVTSITQPDQDSWYATSTVALAWSRPSGAYGFSFAFDQTPDTTPHNVLDTTVTTSTSYDNVKDGISYFHIKARGQTTGYGNTAHFRVQLDTEWPLLFDVKLQGNINLNDVPRTPTVIFAAQDEMSGIDHYDIYLDDQLAKANAVSSYNFDMLSSGPHVIRVVAFDKAGNNRKSELPIIVTGPQVVTQQVTNLFQRYMRLPVYALLAMNFVLLVLVIVLLALFYQRRRKGKEMPDQIAAIQAQIDASLEQLKKQLSKQLQKFADQSTIGVYDKEVEVEKEVSSDIGKTKRLIDKEVGKLRSKKKRTITKIIEEE
jgi:hypothetical protein